MASTTTYTQIQNNLYETFYIEISSSLAFKDSVFLVMIAFVLKQFRHTYIWMQHVEFARD